MTFWDFANQHPWMAAVYAFGFWLLGVILASSLERKPKPGFKHLKRRLEALEPCNSSPHDRIHLWVPSDDPAVLKCRHCGIMRQA